MHKVVWHQKTAGSQRSDQEQGHRRAPPADLLTPRGE